MRTRPRTAPNGPSGIRAEGDAPGWWGAMRTRRTPGRERKTSGGSRLAASPSMPAATLPPESTWNVSDDHCRFRAPSFTPITAMPSMPMSRRGRVAHPVGIVRDEQNRSGAVLAPVGTRPAQIEAPGARAEHLGRGVGDRAQLRLAVALALH